MKILFVLDDFLKKDIFGGGDIIAQTIKTGLESRSNIIEVACSWDDTGISNTNKVHKILTPKNMWKKASTLQFFFYCLKDRMYLRRVLNDLDPDVLYCLHQGGIAIPTISWVNRLNIPKVYRFGYEWVRLYYYKKKNNWNQFWENHEESTLITFGKRLLMAAIDPLVKCKRLPLNLEFAIFNSVDLMNRHKSFLTYHSDFIVIPNGVDLSLFSPLLHKLSTTPKLLFIGRIVPHKGLHNLISALHLLKNRCGINDIQLTIVGASSNKKYESEVRYLAKKSELDKAIRWIGGVQHSNVPFYFNNNDIFVFPSIQRSDNITVEGCPSIILEALSSGIPIVARITSGVNEILKDEESCVGVYDDIPQSLADGVIRLINNKILYEKLSRNGPLIVKEKYTVEEMLSKTENFLTNAIKKNCKVYHLNNNSKSI